jgi:hypothetical protein
MTEIVSPSLTPTTFPVNLICWRVAFGCRCGGFGLGTSSRGILPGRGNDWALGCAPLRHTLQVPPFFPQFVQPVQFLQAAQTPDGLHFAATAGTVGQRMKAAKAKRSTVDFMRSL